MPRSDDPTLFPVDPVGPRSGEFSGAAYEPAKDHDRLTGQIKAIWQVMSDGNWRTVAQLVRLTGFPANSVQAQLRNLRKAEFGAYLVERRRTTDTGLYEWRLGGRGEGTPTTKRCKNCEALEERLVAVFTELNELKRSLVSDIFETQLTVGGALMLTDNAGYETGEVADDPGRVYL
jgi:hypothetical protein